jgi:hypothetical protein
MHGDAGVTFEQFTSAIFAYLYLILTLLMSSSTKKPFPGDFIVSKVLDSATELVCCISSVH